MLLLSHFSHVRPCETPYQAPPSLGFSRPRTLEWVAISFSNSVTGHFYGNTTPDCFISICVTLKSRLINFLETVNYFCLNQLEWILWLINSIFYL